MTEVTAFALGFKLACVDSEAFVNGIDDQNFMN